MGQTGRKPVSESCSAFSHTLYGARMGQHILKVVRAHVACRVITHGSSGFWPLRDQ